MSDERAPFAIDSSPAENLNVFQWKVNLTVFCPAPPSAELAGVLDSIPELTHVDPVVREPFLRFVHWEVRSNRDSLDELDEHVEDVLAQLRSRRAQLGAAIDLGGELSLEVRCTPPPGVLPGLVLSHRHVSELAGLRASIAVEVLEH